MRLIYLVSGANSPVGRVLLALLRNRGAEVWALTRGALPDSTPSLQWLYASEITLRYQKDFRSNPMVLLAVAPLWSVTETVDACVGIPLQKIVALGSTSEYTKANSNDPYDLETVARLQQGAAGLRERADSLQIPFLLLRTTMIYGPDDRNLNFWRRFARYAPVLPLIAGGRALRQPVHSEDVAAVILAAADYAGGTREFIIAGPRPLSYRQMLESICQQLGVKRQYVTLPVFLLKTAVAVIRFLPGMKALRPAMIERMQQDMVFPIDKARQELGFAPREFGSKGRDRR
ncbi:MAG TPA: hypothetical protein ENI62_04695 [Gammaproteobacteria bacterium]|nr:hypothetical protein [Gammaproteobacteria bacterium]